MLFARRTATSFTASPRRMQDDEAGGWAAFSSLVITTGKRDASVLQYFKSVAFHQWLFGLEVAGKSRIEQQTFITQFYLPKNVA